MAAQARANDDAPTYPVDVDAHLSPGETVFSQGLQRTDFLEFVDSYHANVVKVLRGAYGRHTFARVVVMPSLQNEYAVALAHSDDEFRVLHVEADQSIWAYSYFEMFIAERDASTDKKLSVEDEELMSLLPKRIADYTVTKCEKTIPHDLGHKLYSLWGEMLFRTRYPDQRPLKFGGTRSLPPGLDGVNYDFSFDYSGQTLAGHIWSPSETSPTGKFVHITGLLKEACHSDDPAIFQNITTKVDTLADELSKSAY